MEWFALPILVHHFANFGISNDSNTNHMQFDWSFKNETQTTNL